MKIETELDLQGNRIANVADAIEDGDAVNLGLVKSLISQPQDVFELTDNSAKPYITGEAIEVVDLSALTCGTVVVNLVINMKILFPKPANNLLDVVLIGYYAYLENGLLKSETGSSCSKWFFNGKGWILVWLSNGVFNPVIIMNGGKLGDIAEITESA
jgi:hypothetical protein